MKNDSDPIVSSGSDDSPPGAEPRSSVIDGPPPGNWAQLREVWRATRARLQRRTPAPSKPSRERRAAPPEAEAAPAAAIKAFEQVHGKPMLWMAPFFLAFAFVFAFPMPPGCCRPRRPGSSSTIWSRACPRCWRRCRR